MPENWTSQWSRAEEELERSPALLRAVECALRLVLGALLAGGEVLGSFAPFGVGFVACSGSGVEALCATAGAVIGYLFFHGFTQGLRFAAAAVLTFSVAFAFYDVRVYKKWWFMPLVAAGMDGVTGFVYLSESGWRAGQTALFAVEVALAGASAWLYREALALRRERGGGRLSLGQKVSALFLLGTVLMSLSGVELPGGVSLGRVLTALLMLAVAYAGGAGQGAAAGVALGLGMDAACAGVPLYTMAYGFGGLVSGAGWRLSRLYAAVAGVLANAAAVLWSWQAVPRASALYEMFIASVIFLVLPEPLLRELKERLKRQEGARVSRSADHVGQRLSAVAAAFGRVGETLRAALREEGKDDGDPAAVFDRTAQRVCQRCALRNTCWEKDYVNTYNALNDAVAPMEARGRGEPGDYPGWFSSRCMQFPLFLKTVNEEFTALRTRRQYRSRVRENRSAVCGQYETVSRMLDQLSGELSAELTPDPAREKRLRTHLSALGLEAQAAAWYDQRDRLWLEAAGDGVEVLAEPDQLRQLSKVMGMPLRRGGFREEGRIDLVREEDLMAVAGVAARRREGQRESGDTGSWFKRDDGSVFVLLCDGMGSGEAALRESALAVRLLESFLRAGMESERAMETVNSALALRNEDTGAFTTVDLLRIDLYTGEGELCKLGAAPSYICQAGKVKRYTGSALPAGLVKEGRCDVARLKLAAGDCVLLLSDGVCDGGEDGWVRALVEGFDGESPKELTRAVMEASETRTGPADDRTAMAVVIKRRERR